MNNLKKKGFFKNSKHSAKYFSGIIRLFALNIRLGSVIFPVMKILMKNIISALQELAQVLFFTPFFLPRRQLVRVRINDGRQVSESRRGERRHF